MDYKQKRATVEALLDHWQDFILPSPGFGMSDGEGLGFAFASGMSSYPSVVELNRCLEVLSTHMPNHYSHLRGFYATEWRTMMKPVKIRAASGKMIDDEVRSRERIVPKWVIWRLVDRGLDVVCGLWRIPPEDDRCADCRRHDCDFHVKLELPPALMRKLEEFTDQHGVHYREVA